MTDWQQENEQRWAAYWSARERGADDRATYDRYLHPGTRIPTDQVAADLAKEPTR